VLLDMVSPELRSRLQGKPCFNFTLLEPEMVGESKRLTEAGSERYREAGLDAGK
jgi:hypothetical protein